MLLIFDLKTTSQVAPLAQSNLQAFLQAKSMKSHHGETCKINQHLSKVLYFTVVLHILQCAHVTYIMLTHHMKAFPTSSNFHLKIIRKCVENQYRKSCQLFLPPGLVFGGIWASKIRPKIISKSQKIILATQKTSPCPSQSLQEGSEASADATGCLPKPQKWLQEASRR